MGKAGVRAGVGLELGRDRGRPETVALRPDALFTAENAENAENAESGRAEANCCVIMCDHV